MMDVQREQIQKCIARLFDGDAVAYELTNYIERNAPALFYFIDRKAAGRLSTGRTASEKFLRSLPEPIFAHLLACALDFFRQGARCVEELANMAPELGSLAFVLLLEERGLDSYVGTDDELYTLMDSLARLVLIEEQERLGAFVSWIDRYSLLNRLIGKSPSLIGGLC